MQNSTRWGLVTFATGITCGTLGSYLPLGVAHFAFVVVAVIFAMIGAASVQEEK